MLYEDLYSSFVESYNDGDMKSATLSLMRELANILVRNKADFVHLLNESEIPATIDMTDVRLVDLYIDNITKSKKLVLGSALLVAMHNKQMGFDGDEELSDDAVKGGYSAILDFFTKDDSNARDFYNFDMDSLKGLGQSTAGGAASGGVVGAIAGAVSDTAKLGTKIAEGKQKGKYGAIDMASKKQEAKSAMMQQLLAQRQAQIEAATKQKETKAKTTKTLLIVGGVIVGLAIIAGVFYAIKKGKKK